MKITNIPTEIKTTKTEITINKEVYNIQVKNNLSINEFNGMCNSIVNSCFDKNNTYLPYLKNQLIKAYTIDYYTDIELSNNSEENSALYNNFGIVNTILEVIDFEQYNAILYAIDEMIEMRIKKFDYNSNKVKIAQYTISGKFIRIWNSISEAEYELRINNIYNAIHKGGSSGNYQWKYYEGNDSNITPLINTNTKNKHFPIQIFDKKTGNFISEYNSVQECVKNNSQFNSSQINRVLSGIIKSHKGFVFKYKDEDMI